MTLKNTINSYSLKLPQAASLALRAALKALNYSLIGKSRIEQRSVSIIEDSREVLSSWVIPPALIIPVVIHLMTDDLPHGVDCYTKQYG
ncbi:unnamed protein product [Clonostachys chloroleuca]|uniref:Uncharacterized protein n=1 Tax=Clonostachys chloroleuca TaxID=1926264 RepID=A0AA35LWR2_9HYPO|nr:unnamed protein product [Clonostachys chloroleuca]